MGIGSVRCPVYEPESVPCVKDSGSNQWPDPPPQSVAGNDPGHGPFLPIVLSWTPGEQRTRPA